MLKVIIADDEDKICQLIYKQTVQAVLDYLEQMRDQVSVLVMQFRNQETLSLV
ncbi:hypothetical protein [Anaerocolumna sedimenticola]|uniref:hypothetical protein n=1 Tax=Anaerocolumna sedimenticola TaxID=2696063 RepID=UPI00192A4B04